ncbi:MAG: hypothetical protein ACRCWO_14435 [Bosea sp. (in: a-proteobacteria)]
MRFGATALFLGLGLAGCMAQSANTRANAVELSAAQGWVRLPTSRWLLNEGVLPRYVLMCPRATCTHMSMIALFEASGEAAAAMERELASDKVLSNRKNKRPPPRTIGGKPQAPKGTETTAETTIERFTLDGAKGYRVALTPKIDPKLTRQTPPPPPGNHAFVVVLTKREGAVLKAAIAVTTDPDLALGQARAAAQSW